LSKSSFHDLKEPLIRIHQQLFKSSPFGPKSEHLHSSTWLIIKNRLVFLNFPISKFGIFPLFYLIVQGIGSPNKVILWCHSNSSICHLNFLISKFLTDFLLLLCKNLEFKKFKWQIDELEFGLYIDE
jgi:hypothetical protein